MSTQEQNTPNRDDSEMRMITLGDFKDLLIKAYTAGALAEREGKHTPENLIDADILQAVFESKHPNQ